MPYRRRCLNIAVTIFIGILLGVVAGVVWYSGLVPNIRQVIPYIEADMLAVISLTIITGLVFSRIRFSEPGTAEGDAQRCDAYCLANLVKTIITAAAVFIIFILVFISALPVNPVKTIIAFIGSASYGVMLTAFIQLVFWIVRRR